MPIGLAAELDRRAETGEEERYTIAGERTAAFADDPVLDDIQTWRERDCHRTREIHPAAIDSGLERHRLISHELKVCVVATTNRGPWIALEGVRNWLARRVRRGRDSRIAHGAHAADKAVFN